MMRWESPRGTVEIRRRQAAAEQQPLEQLLADGLHHHRAGRLAEAESAYRQCLQRQPRYADALHLLGLIAHQTERHVQARRLIAAAISLQPDSAVYHSNCGEVCRHLQDFEPAVAHLERAVSLKPDYAEAHNNLGCTFADMARIEDALACFERALVYEPDYAEAHNHRANMLLDLGRVDEAKTAYHRAIALKPGFAKALAHLAMVAPTEIEPKTLESGLEDKNIAADDRVHFHTALGAVLSKRGEDARAFEHYCEANRLRRREFEYDAEAQSKLIDEIMRTFSAQWVADTRDQGEDSELPVFIVGMPRSGTTLVEQILSSHPLVHGAGELATLERAERRLLADAGDNPDYPAALASPSADARAEAAAIYLEDLRARAPGAHRVTDKMPLNFLRIGTIRRLFPKARIIHCRRSALDTCVSIFCSNFKDTRGNAFAFDLAETGRFYRDYERLMAHWHKVLPWEILDVEYEALLEDQRGISQRMIEYLGLPWDEACLSFTDNHRAVSTASNLQVRQPLYRSSVGRWKRYGDALEPLFTALGRRS